MIINLLPIRYKIIAALAIVFTGGLVATVPPVHAVTGSDWQAGNIISDSVFYNSNSMNASQIQAFLNAKVPVCDTNGTTRMDSGQTRAAYSIANGHSPPFTCLKDYIQATPTQAAEPGLCNTYSGGTKTSAQIIYDVAQACGVSPQVLLVLLQKEQSLVTDTWPWDTQYRSATGYGCPDTAACDSTYYGFFNQVYMAARQYKLYAKNATSYSYRAGRSNSIQYNPSASCGSSGVYVQNQATAGLYIYTPYQPNTAALSNLYGSGDSCSAYGNRNFWRQFSDWFGSTTDPDAYFYVTDTNPDNGANLWYLITPKGKFYIPSLDVYYAWGLNNYAFQTADKAYFDSIPDGGNLGRLLTDSRNGNQFFIDGGKLHYLRSSTYKSIYGLDSSTNVVNAGLAAALPGGTWAGRFMQDESTGDMWLADGGMKRSIPSASPQLYHWGYTADQLNIVSSTYLASLTDGGALSRYISTGGNKFLVDSGRYVLLSSLQQSAYNSGSYQAMNNIMTTSFLPVVSGNAFVEDNDSGGWYMLEGGRKHYIPNIETAQNWGYQKGSALLRVSHEFLASLTDGGNLNTIVKDDSGVVWIVDGQKHQVPSGKVSDWTTDSSTLPTYSNDSLSSLVTGQQIGSFIKTYTDPFIYTVDNGVKHYLSNSDVQKSWGVTNSNTTALNSTFVYAVLPEGQFTKQVVQDSSNNAFVVNGSTLYPIADANKADWGSSAAWMISSGKKSQYTVSDTTVTIYYKVGGVSYIASNGQSYKLGVYADTYSVPNSTPVLAGNPLDINGEASYLVKSTDSVVSTMWFVNLGSKIQFPSFAEQANYGYVSQGRSVTALSPSTLASIPNSSDSPSLLVRKENAGVKLLSFGYALGFPDGDTLNNYVSTTNPILTLAPSVYDSFQLRREASRVIRDDSNVYYLIENGQRRKLTNIAATTYNGWKKSYLEGTTMVDLPLGANYN